jgi:hypothetical protein
VADARERIHEDLIVARSNLEGALYYLWRITDTNPKNLSFGPHAIDNLLTLATITTESLMNQLSTHDDPQVRVGLNRRPPRPRPHRR